MTIGGNYGYDVFVGQGGMGANVQNGTLETSNTDLTEQMVEQMAEQNGTEANAQTIKTSDSMMQTLLDIKA
ncbi:flagellar basal body rod C-terminal domain-containing protein [Helicobacter sp.]|uniref:flagellar basal body rod C-terminal domain-containing protein n=1 Tax=Helicobacter sp. TaxID=218 RepID=UPI0025C709AE|nr:flagellar basal body rod C-terminal domain-containing protein [Helicobacter sp.]MCI5969055.1 hypothetical protein [Helicobacter sp.]MDY2585351.1 flagellar basal body rod C-terminal domain-containing protein [Helicobacter sp.]